MARSSSTEARLAELNELMRAAEADGGLDDAARAAVRKALTAAGNFVVAAAARAARAGRATDLLDDLTAAFMRFIERPERDRTCAAKHALIEALLELDCDRAEPFLAGVRHVQLEPAFGGPEDVAVPVRVLGLRGLALINHHDLWFWIGESLCDAQVSVRRAAVQLLGELGGPQSEALLRMELRHEDPVAGADALIDTLAALMQANPERSLPRVAEYLNHPRKPVADGAAVALGRSRAPGALEALTREFAARPAQTDKAGLLVPIALLRSDEAFAFLLELVGRAVDTIAAEALDALQLMPLEPQDIEAVRRTVAARDDRALSVLCRELFGRG